MILNSLMSRFWKLPRFYVNFLWDTRYLDITFRLLQKYFLRNVSRQFLYYAEMEYYLNATSMLAEEIQQNAEGFVEVPTNM